MRSNQWQILLVLLLFIKSSYGVQREFCKQEYGHIGKHTWRCKERLNRDESTININLSNGNHNTHGTANVEAIHGTVYVNDSLLNSNKEINVTNYDDDLNDNKKELPFRCYCRRYFESLRGLNVHWRSCFITGQASLKNLFIPSDFIPSVIPYDIPNDFEHLPKANLLSGVKLPKKENDWNIANDYFKLHLHHNSEITGINLAIRTFNQTMYN